MRIGASLFLIAAGAVLRWGITDQVRGIDLSTIGLILLVVGAIGLVLSVILASVRRRTDIVHEDAPPRYVADGGTRRTTYVEPSEYDRRL